jgi:hypothetical protein
MRSDPATVPPENATVADSRGRLGSGSAYAVGHAAAVVEENGDGVGVADVAVTIGISRVVVLSVVVTTCDGCGVASAPFGAVEEPAQAVASAAATTHQVLTSRR